jgi:predicted nucleic-acid-binding Zn-ribbon protein
VKNIYCPKCGGENIESVVISPAPKKLSMDEVVRGWSDLVYRSGRRKLVCKDCGYSRELSEPRMTYGVT